MTLRFGGFKTTNASQTYICPTFIEDPIGTWVPSLTYLPYQAIPEISFTGYASGSRSEWFLNLLAHYRRNFLRLLKKDLSDKQSFFPVAFKRNQCATVCVHEFSSKSSSALAEERSRGRQSGMWMDDRRPIERGERRAAEVACRLRPT